MKKQMTEEIQAEILEKYRSKKTPGSEGRGMTNEDAIAELRDIETDDPEIREAYDLAISALERDRWISDPQKFPNTDARVVGYFGGGAFNQLRWFDFVTTLSDGRMVAESNERYVINEHLIAVFQLPEPPKEEYT